MFSSKKDGEMLKQLLTLQPQILARCYRVLMNPAKAEDAAQDVLIQAIIKLPSYHPKAPLEHWAMRIATNHCLNVLRDDKHTTSYDGDHTSHLLDKHAFSYSSVHAVENTICHSQYVMEIMALAQVHKPRWDYHDYAIFVARFQEEEISWVEVGEIVKLPVSTVKTRYSSRIQPVLDQIRQEHEAGGRELNV